MAKLLKLRRGTTSQHGSFTGAEGEVTVDTDKETLVVHNGSQAGGYPLLRQDMSNLPGGTIDNADVSNSAAIAGTKISPNFGSQDITTTGDLNCSDITLTDAHPVITFTDNDNNPDFIIKGNSGNIEIEDVTNNRPSLTVYGSDNHIDIHGNLDVGAGIDVTGNMTVTGTVDGRDVATDGSKLDGIASGATNNGSGSLSSYLPLSGGTLTGALSGTKATFSDNGSSDPIVTIATDDDSPWAFAIRNDSYWNNANNGLKIYQDNSGNIDHRITGNGAFINYYIKTQNGGTTNTAIHVNTDRSVNLRYQGNEKLTTTSDGVDFGAGGASDILCISGQTLHRTGSNGCGMHFTSSAIYPTDSAANLNNGGMSLGASNYRWGNIYTSDLDLSNEAKGGNDVDGTWGHWTIQEGESDLFLKNNRSGKKYKFNLTEVS